VEALLADRSETASASGQWSLRNDSLCLSVSHSAFRVRRDGRERVVPGLGYAGCYSVSKRDSHYELHGPDNQFYAWFKLLASGAMPTPSDLQKLQDRAARAEQGRGTDAGATERAWREMREAQAERQRLFTETSREAQTIVAAAQREDREPRKQLALSDAVVAEPSGSNEEPARRDAEAKREAERLTAEREREAERKAAEREAEKLRQELEVAKRQKALAEAEQKAAEGERRLAEDRAGREAERLKQQADWRRSERKSRRRRRPRSASVSRPRPSARRRDYVTNSKRPSAFSAKPRSEHESLQNRPHSGIAWRPHQMIRRKGNSIRSANNLNNFSRLLERHHGRVRCPGRLPIGLPLRDATTPSSLATTTTPICRISKRRLQTPPLFLNS
jgi:hypothetical protein